MIIYEDSQYTLLVNTCAAPRRNTTTVWEYIVAPKKQCGKNGKIPDTTEQLPEDDAGQQKKKQRVAEAGEVQPSVPVVRPAAPT